MPANAVSVRDVSKTFRVYHDRNQSLKATVLKRGRAKYEEFWALKGVDLDIAEGQTFGLLGRNGSGKSTLLKCIAGILTPNTGSITTRGRVAAMLEVGSGFHPELSGRENIYLNGAILGMTKQEVDRKLDAIVDFSGVERFIDHPVKNYSSGMYVRLGFSVSIHTEPDLLLVDEVLAVGDMEFQAKCQEKFAALKRDGKTVVVVSHDLGTMRTFCDRAAWLDHGELQAVGRASTIVDKYADDNHHVHGVEGGGKRHGTGEVRFTKAALLDEDGREVTEIRPDQPVTLRMHYDAPRGFESPNFSATINTMHGQRMWAIIAQDRGFLPTRLEPGSGTVDIAIAGLPLQPAEYEIGVEVRGIDEPEPADSVQAISKFAMRRAAETYGGMLAIESAFVDFSTGLTSDRAAS
ncbi:ABC transporter ATP-binding protein [Agrococcus lahaulensis]|uniref:ABC transporter ATP-binding protein n=1 Tax=Agrococcus lahaulensis TaxID=341722 RepID=UPI0009FF797C|nr:ABC transporter ATP-binding protein [Agrococcus lahaulensis]